MSTPADTTAVSWPSPPRLPPLCLGSLRLQSRYLLAPLAGYTNLAFRLVVRRLGGVGLATTDLISAVALLRGSRKTLELITTCPADQPLAIQLYGASPAEMVEAARWLEAYGASVVDINMGCPVRKVVRTGSGSALMCRPRDTLALVQRIVEAVRLPVTVKMRLGWDDSDWSAPFFAREFEQIGVAAVTIHGRTRAQGFSGTVNLEGIRAVVEAVERLPVIGNGDVHSVADAERMLRVTGCTGIAIGRGALLNPWIFRQLQQWEQEGVPGPAGGYAERLDLMAEHFQNLLEQRGERLACLTFRKIAGWYCRVLKPGHTFQQQLVQLASAATFWEIVTQLRAQGPPPGWEARFLGQPIRLPSGPVAYW